MGEISDMMLDGTLCMDCGEYIGKEDEGYPQRCNSCEALTKKNNKRKGKNNERSKKNKNK